MRDPIDCSLTDIAQAIRDRAVSSEEITRWSLRRLEGLGPKYNAVFYVDAERALQTARDRDSELARGEIRGSLHGVPLAHKGLFDVKGWVNHAGSLVLRDNVATSDAFVIRKMDDAGQVNLGLLSMSEFALSPTGFNGHYGQGLNPWNSDCISGGSSSGSGIAVAGRMVFGSIGGDTGGSVRLPPAMCGITGIKPTFRRVSTRGAIPLSSSLDCLGPLAQTARDCARLLTVTAAPDPGDAISVDRGQEDFEAGIDEKVEGLRLGVVGGYYSEEVDPEVAAGLDAAVDVLKSLGMRASVARAPDSVADCSVLAKVVMSVEAASIHGRWIRSRPEDYSDQVRNRIEQGFAYPAVRYVEALSMRRGLLQEYVATVFRGCDVAITPTMPITPPTIVETTSGDHGHVQQMIRLIGQFARGLNYLGLPAITVPAGFSRTGLPLAFQLVGKPFSESLLLRVANAYQQATDWHRRLPTEIPRDA